MRTLLLPLKLTNVTENMISIHDYLKNSYNEKKEWLAESIAFFKDFSQMEEEFRQELLNKNEYCICLEGEMVTESLGTLWFLMRGFTMTVGKAMDSFKL